MTSYDPYDREYTRRYVREERREDRRDDRDARFIDPYGRSSNRDMALAVPRSREDSDLSIEEVRRDFPPPSGARDVRRARSAEPYYEDDIDYRREYDRYDSYDRRSRKGGGSSYYEEETRKGKGKGKGMSKEEKIIAAVAGAALLAGGKELYDRREAKTDGTDVQRNTLSSIALAGVGALAAYQGAEFYNKQQAKKDQKATYILHRGRDGHVSEYYSDDEDAGPKEKKGHRNFLESALAATGLGAAAKSLMGGKEDDKSDTRSRGGSSRSTSRVKNANKMQKAAMASLLAGATEAFRVAKEPGGWKGEKTRRIFTAAAGAAAVDGVHGKEHGKMGLAESVIGGLVGNRLINGSRKEIEEDKTTGRSRSRSRARSRDDREGGGSGLAALATAGLGAFAGKKAYDGYRSRSRGRQDDSRSPSPDRRKRSRSRSVVDKARSGLAKLGIGSAGGAGALTAADDERRHQDDYSERGGSRRSRSRYSDDYDDSRSRRDYDDDRSYRGSRRGGGDRRRGTYDSSSDPGDSSEDEKQHRKLRGKQVLTTGLAAVATIHAAHGVYQSMEKREARHKAVKQGRLSPEEAKKLKTKAFMQDAASVGIAALGVKGAISELKEAKEITHECASFRDEKCRRHEKRERRRQQLREYNNRQGGDSESPRGRDFDSDYYYSDDDDYDRHYHAGNSNRSQTLPLPSARGISR